MKPNQSKQKLNLYIASDTDFMHYLAKKTKIKPDKLFQDMNLKEGWNNGNRLPGRLCLVKQFEKLLIS